jgi:GTP:adenosylcobinamide-phosphate guanylyltransferase
VAITLIKTIKTTKKKEIRSINIGVEILSSFLGKKKINIDEARILAMNIKTPHEYKYSPKIGLP